MLSHKISHPADLLDHEWKDLDQISTTLPIAVIAAKDQTFPTRPGFDLALFKKAIAEHQIGQAIPSSSSISRQTARNLFLWSNENSSGGGLESWLAFLLETSLDKRAYSRNLSQH